MKLDRYVLFAILFSVLYLTLDFLFESQITAFLPDPIIRMWITLGITGINLILLFICLFTWGTKLTGIILLIIVQVGIFLRLFMNVYTLVGPENYAFAGTPGIGDWLLFLGVHTIKALDFLDFVDIFAAKLTDLTTESMQADISLFSMYLILGLFTIGGILRGINLRPKDQNIPRSLIYTGAVLFAASLGGIIFLTLEADKGITQAILMPFIHLLLLIDVGDACQIFEIVEPAKTGTLMAGIVMLFRLVSATSLLLIANRYYLKFTATPQDTIQTLAKTASNPELSEKERISAIETLGQYGMFADSAIPALVSLLADPLASVRSTASQSLEEIEDEWMENESVVKAIPALIKSLSAAEDASRLAACQVLADFGPRSKGGVKELSTRLTDKNAQVRLAAAKALGNIGEPAASGVRPLVEALNDPDREVKKTAYASLRKIGPWGVPRIVESLPKTQPGIQKPLLKLLDSVSPKWRETQAVTTLIENMTEQLEDGNDDTRKEAVRTISIFGKVAEPALPRLINLLADGDEEIRRLAGKTLEEINPNWSDEEEGRKAMSRFVLMLLDPDINVRKAANNALELIDPDWQHSIATRKAIPDLVKHLGPGMSQTRIMAADILGGIGTGAKAALPALISILADPDEEVRSAAVIALGKIDSDWQKNKKARKILFQLTEGLTHQDWEVRSASAGALGEMGASAQFALFPLMKCLVDPDRNVRNTVLAALMKIDPEWKKSPSAKKAITYYVRSLSNTHVQVRLAAVRALQEMGRLAGPGAPYLVKALKDSTVDVQNAAKKALKVVDPEGKYRKKAVKTESWGKPDVKTALMDEINISAPDALFKLAQKRLDTDPGVRKAAEELMNRVNPEWPGSEEGDKIMEIFSEGLSHSNWNVRKEAIFLIARFGEDAYSSLPRLRKMSTTDSSIDVCNAAKKAIHQIDPEGKFAGQTVQEDEIGELTLENPT